MAPLALLLVAASALSFVSASPLAPRANGYAFLRCPAVPANTNTPTPCNGQDAPYSVAENSLYSNIKGYGVAANKATKPFLLVPGTGATGPEAWEQGYVILLQNLGYQPFVISPPRFMLDDLQVEAEYAAYAVRTLSAASGQPVPVITWSAGGLAQQWAQKYWLSVRGQTDRFIPFAPDFLGTVVAIYTAATLPIAPASVRQQRQGSNFIKALRANGGACAYVPTSSVYSLTDEVVIPEFPSPNPLATSYIAPGPNAPASNNVVQPICANPQTTVYDHAFHLWNAFTYSAVVAALNSSTKVTPATFTADCSGLPAPGLTPVQAAALNAGELVDLARIASPAFVVASEPVVKPYASNPIYSQSCSNPVPF